MQGFIRFTSVVKTAHVGYPSKYLGSVQMSGRGQWFSMKHSSDDPHCDIGAVIWVYRERPHFVTTCGTTVPGDTIIRDRYRQMGPVARKITTTTEIPKVAETYYSVASQIDRHNRCRQHDLQLEKKFGVREWSMRVNTSLLAMCIVDAYLLYRGNYKSRDPMARNAFYTKLAEEMIDNNYGHTVTRSIVAFQQYMAENVSGIL